MNMPPEAKKPASRLGNLTDLSQKAAFLHNFVRSQQSRLKRTSTAAAWRRDAQFTKEQALRTETELQRLVSELQTNGTLHAAFCQEWVEHERQSQLSLHQLKLQCSANVAQLRKGCKVVSTSTPSEEHMQSAQQLEKKAWDLAQDIRQLQDELDNDDPSMPQWWLKMLSHPHRHWSGQRSSTVDADRCSIQPCQALNGVERINMISNDEASGNQLLEDGAKSSANEPKELSTVDAMVPSDGGQALGGTTVTEEEDWQTEAQAEKSLLEDKPSAAGSLPSGWTAQESFAFQVSVRQTLSSAPAGCTRVDVLEAVQRLMPSKSMEQLRDMDSHIWNASLWWSRLQELRQKWLRQYEAVRSGCQAMLEHSVSSDIDHAEFCAEVVRVEVEKARLANSCTVQQGHRQQRQLSNTVEESAKHAREHSRRQHTQETQLLRQENNKTLVNEYAQYRRTLVQQQMQHKSEVLEMARHHKRPTRLHNLQRVKYRQHTLARKHEEALQQDHLLAEEWKLREQRMERIRAQVQVNVKVDKERVFQPTKSSMTEVYKHASLFADRHGFSEDQVTSDKRYRTIEMLKAKGVLQKPYARDLVRRIHFDGDTQHRRNLTTDVGLVR